MYPRSFLACLLLLPCAATTGFGYQLHRAYTTYVPQPIDAFNATSQGWKSVGPCIAGLGIPFTTGGKLSRHTPMTLYFTPLGQISGVGTDVYGKIFDSLVGKGYYLQMDANRYSIAVGFREPLTVCGETRYDELLGDRLVINPQKMAQDIPLKSDQLQGYQEGACFDGMGTHHFRDFTGQQSWVGANLQPVIPMYDAAGDVNAIFFASGADVQQGVLPPSANGWEPVPLINTLMCKNWCDSHCTFTDTTIWSTMHFYFNSVSSKDSNYIKCGGKCFAPGIGCCPGSKISPKVNATGLMIEHS